MPKKNVIPAYDNNTMAVHSDLENVRENPETYLGSATIEGCRHTFLEILANSLDEVKNGFGNRVEVKLYKDGSLSVRDYGRGIPLDYNEKEQKYNYDIAYCKLGGGGKFANDDEDSVYKSGTLGVHGIGAAATQLSSDWMIVDSYRDGKRYHIEFVDGKPVGEGAEALKIEKLKNKDMTGTFQWWKPSNEVFIDTNIDAEYLKMVLKQQAVVTKEATITLEVEETGERFEYHYENGIQDYMREKTREGEDLFSPILYFEQSGQTTDKDTHSGKFSKPYSILVQAAIGFSTKVQEIEYFHNSSLLEYGGSPDKALKAAIVFAIDKEIKTLGKYKANESKIKFQDVEECLVFISNSFSGRTIYEGQTKKAIDSPGVFSFMYEMLKENLNIWFIENRLEAEKICDVILNNKRSRETSESQRSVIKKKFMQSMDVTNRVKKFIDCREKDQSKRELFICEGDSALGSLKMGRDSNFQALMPIRGKILNCYKADLNQIFKSEIITDLIRVLGCGVEVKGKHAAKDMIDFDIEKLRYNKIILMTDADVDGYHIRTLLITMIYRLCPKLIEEGKVFIGETPLYEITYSNGKKEETFFAYSDGEKEKIIRGKDMKKIKIQRSKGLGENTPEMMWNTSMNPETRHLIRVNKDNAEEAQRTIELFMGDAIGPRKEYIEQNGAKYLENLDME